MGNPPGKETGRRPELRLGQLRKRRASLRTLAVLASALTVGSCSQPVPEPQPSTDATESSSAEASPVPAATTSPDSVGEEAGNLQDPLDTRRPIPGVSERIALSEQGTGTGTYPLDTALAPGQTVMVTASCPEGERVVIESDAGLLWTDLVCGNPAVSSYTSPPAPAGAADKEIRVSTAEGEPYWLLVTVQDPPS